MYSSLKRQRHYLEQFTELITSCQMLVFRNYSLSEAEVIADVELAKARKGLAEGPAQPVGSTFNQSEYT